jgi:hypothetical protein
MLPVYMCRSVGAGTARAAGRCSRHPSSSATAAGRGHTARPRLPASELPVGLQHKICQILKQCLIFRGGGVASAMLVGMCRMMSIMVHTASQPRAIHWLLLLQQQRSDV